MQVHLVVECRFRKRIGADVLSWSRFKQHTKQRFFFSHQSLDSA
jgi:hypothetical protein